MSEFLTPESIKGLVNLLGETQLKYRRLYFTDCIQELAPRPATASVKIKLPTFFKSLFDDQCNLVVYSVAGRKYSFWHGFLYILYPGFIDRSWYERKGLVDRLIDELNRDVDNFFKIDAVLSKTTMNASDVRFHDDLPSDELKYYIASRFHINMVIVDTTMIEFVFEGLTWNPDVPTFLLYRDDTTIFHVIAVNDSVLFNMRDCQVLKGLLQLAPDTNRILVPYITKATSGLDMYATVNELTGREKFELDVKPGLEKLKLGELQVLALKYKIDTHKQGKTKKIAMTKKEIIDTIIDKNMS